MRLVSIISGAVSLITILGFQSALAQFPIKVPKTPKTDRAKPEPAKNDGTNSSENATTGSNETKSATTTGAKKVYVNLYATSTPRLIKDSIYIQAKSHDSYWKMPNQKNYSSWVPTLSFGLFYDNSSDVKLLAENPASPLALTGSK